jgi:glycosyl transferase family 87
MATEALHLPEAPRLNFRRVLSSRPLRVSVALVGTAALAEMVLVAWQMATASVADPTVLVPSSHNGFPSWMAGPLHAGQPMTVHAISVSLVLLSALYLVVLACSRALPAWIALPGVVALTAIFTLAPPLLSTDIFNYIAYARMGVLYHLNPYVHGAAAIPLDPSFPPSGHLWNHTPTAYGPLFTLLSYSFVHLGVGGEMWALKILTGLAGLGCSALIWACARKLGVRPLTAVLFFALNPLLLVYTIGGGHNDVLMALPLLGGVLLVLSGWPLLGGVLFMVAVGIKLSAALVLPFVVVAARNRRRVLAGAALGALVIGAASYEVFGSHLRAMLDVLKLNNEFNWTVVSVGGFVGHLAGFGHLTTPRRHVLEIVFAAGAVGMLAWAWRRRDWVTAAAGTILLQLATSGWLLPWYILWVLPLAALARRRWVAGGVVLLSGLLIAMQIQHYVVVHHHDQIALQHREERLAARELRLRIQVRADAARARLAAQRGQQLARAARGLGA